MTEGLEEAVEEDLRLAFLVAGDVGRRPCDEGGKFFGAGVGHDARRLAGRRGCGKDSRATELLGNAVSSVRRVHWDCPVMAS